MLARWQLTVMSFPLRKPLRVSGLFGSDRMCPRRFEAKSSGHFLGSLLRGCFNYRPQRIA
jgi:hypothetical protein